MYYKKAVSIAVFLLLVTYSAAYAYVKSASTEYGKYLAKTIDDVVRTIHATEKKSYITHADILALICVEQRSLNITKSSGAGARGLTQVMPYTFNDYYRTNRHGFRDFIIRTHCTVDKLSSDPRCSIEAGARVFDDLLVRFHGNRNMAAGAYHGGPGAVISSTVYKGPKTQAYAVNWYPSCYNVVANGNAPSKSKIWKALISELAYLTRSTFGVNGVHPQLVDYTAGNQSFVKRYLLETQNKPILKQLVNIGYNPSETQDYGTQTVSNTHAPYGGADASEINNLYSGSSATYKNTSNAPIERAETFFIKQTQPQTRSQEFISKQRERRPAVASNQSKVYMACFPSFVEPGEPFIVAYSCPAGTTEVKDSAIGAGGAKTYLSKKTATHSQEYSVTCRSPQREQTVRCKITVAKPQINNFTITPVNPVFGDKVTVTWSTDNVKSCILSDDKGQVKRTANNGSANFIYERGIHDLTLSCTALTGRIIRKTIQL